jgi:hypothetical protein
MRAALIGLLGLSALLVSSGANAAVQVLCRWEGRSLVAITIEGDVSAFNHHWYHGGSYYDIAVNRSGVWMLLDEPKAVLSVQSVGPRDPISFVWSAHFAGGRCWR